MNRDHLKPKLLVIAERFNLYQRTQKEGECVVFYMAALRRLVDQFAFGTHLEGTLRDEFVCGLCQEVIQGELLTIDGLTLKRAYETAYGMETAHTRASELQVLNNNGEYAAVHVVREKEVSIANSSYCATDVETNQPLTRLMLLKMTEVQGMWQVWIYS